MRKLGVLFLWLLCLPALAACSGRGLSPQQDADLRAAYEKMRVNDIAGLEAQFDPEFRKPALRQGLEFMQGMIPPQAPKVRLLKGVTEKDPQGRLNYGGIYEYDYPSTAVLANIQMRQDAGGRKTLTALRLQQAPVGTAERYAFGLSGRKPYQHLFLVLFAMAPAFGVWGLVALWRARDVRWKPLWAAAMCIGFTNLTMNWATGDVILNLATIQVLWVKTSKLGPVSPWMLTTSLPLAAIAFLLGYRPKRLERPWDGPPKSS